MTEVNLKPVFEYLDDFQGKVDAHFDHVEKRLDNLETSIDNLAKMVRDFRDEHIVLHHRLEVLEEWAKLASKKLGIGLPQ